MATPARFPRLDDVISVNFLRDAEDQDNKSVKKYKVETTPGIFNVHSIRTFPDPRIPKKNDPNPDADRAEMTYVVGVEVAQQGRNDGVFEFTIRYGDLTDATNADGGLGGGGNTVNNITLMPWEERTDYTETGRTMSLKLPTDSVGRIYQNSAGKPFPDPPSRTIPVTVLKLTRKRKFVPGNIATDSRLMRKEYYKTINDANVNIGGITYEPESLLVASFNNNLEYYTYIRNFGRRTRAVIPYFIEEVELWYFFLKGFGGGAGVGWPAVSSVLDEGYEELIEKNLGIKAGNYRKFKNQKNTRSNKPSKLNGGGKFLEKDGAIDNVPPPGIDIDVFQELSTDGEAAVLRFDDYEIVNFNALNLNERLP